MSMAATTSSATPAERVEELGRIILAYSEITERLQASHEQLNATVQRLRQELGEKQRLLERKNRLAALGEMAAGMAHEIRNPLGGIQLYASMLAQDVADRPASLAVVHKISGGVKRLEGLVSQVLQFTREMRASPADVDLAGVIEEAVGLAGPRLAERGARVEMRGPRPMRARADGLLVGQAVLNLVLNAADASPPGGVVAVEWDVGPVVRVRDQGEGVPAGALERIFNPFFTTKDHGTGLGLAIVHRVVEAHEGAVSVRNVGGGWGAEFEMRLGTDA